MATKPLFGVYHLRHIETGKVYSGKTNNLEKQQRYHYTLLSLGKHKSTECQALYDATNDPLMFAFDIEICQDKEQADVVLLTRLKDAREKGLSLNSNRFQLDTPNMGVYKISFSDGSYYICSSKDIRGRISTHDWGVRNNRHKNQAVQQKFDQLGAFSHEVIQHTGDNYRSYEDTLLKQCINDPLCLNMSGDAYSPSAVLWDRPGYRENQERLRNERWAKEGAKENYGEKMKAYWSNPEAKAARSGGNNPFAKKISVDGVVYGSFKSACTAIGLSRHLLAKRLNSDKDTAVFYI